MTVYKSRNFSLNIIQDSDKVYLAQQVHNPVVNTKDLPGTVLFLKENLPTIFDNDCYNPGGNSFENEVCKTEIGHLFEHMLLEYLKLEVEKREGRADFKGVTSWDWNKNKYGSFSIEIESGENYQNDLRVALVNAIENLEKIFESCTNPTRQEAARTATS